MHNTEMTAMSKKIKWIVILLTVLLVLELGAAFGGSERFETFRLDYYPDTVLPNV